MYYCLAAFCVVFPSPPPPTPFPSSCHANEESRYKRSSSYLLILLSPPSLCHPTPISCSRVCGNHHAIIRKYHLMMCRRCFRDRAEDMGFHKVR